MSATISGMLGRLSHELMLRCDEHMVVRETNELAQATLGPRLVGRPLLQLITAMARPKGQAFLDELRSLEPGAVSGSWELLLHVPRAAPLLTAVRGGALPEGGWMLMAQGEAPRLTALYQEVLALNGELTDLIRTLTRQQASLTARLERLLDEGGQADAGHN